MKYVTAVEVGGPLYGSVDLNGAADALVLDADGNTSISAPTDDQIDIEIGGADDFTFTANQFNILTGSAVQFADSTQLQFGDSDDVTIAWDGTDLDILAAADNSTITVGAAGNAFDIKLFGADANGFLTWDCSANDLKLEDSVSLMFGTGAGAGVGNAGDVELRWDATDLDLLAAANNTIFKIGNGTNSFDVWVYGSSANHYFSWDASANDFKMEDSCSLMFGTGAGAGPGTAGDVEIRWDATDLDILGAADDLVIKVGNGTNSFDLWVYGNTASDYLLWDASAGSLTLQGAAYIDLGGSAGHVRHTVRTVTGDTSPAAADSGSVYIVNGGTGTNFTLPAVASSAGLTFRFINGVDQNMTITAPANTMVVHDDVTATSIAFSTAGEKIANGVEVFCDGNFWYTILNLGDDDVTTTVV